MRTNMEKNVNALKWVSKASPPSTFSMMRMAVHTGANTNLPDAKSMRQTAVLFYGRKHAREKTALHTCLVQKLKLLRRRLLIFRFGFVRVVHRRQLPVALLNLIRRGLEEKKAENVALKKGKSGPTVEGGAESTVRFTHVLRNSQTLVEVLLLQSSDG